MGGGDGEEGVVLRGGVQSRGPERRFERSGSTLRACRGRRLAPVIYPTHDIHTTALGLGVIHDESKMR